MLFLKMAITDLRKRRVTDRANALPVMRLRAVTSPPERIESEVICGKNSCLKQFGHIDIYHSGAMILKIIGIW